MILIEICIYNLKIAGFYIIFISLGNYKLEVYFIKKLYLSRDYVRHSTIKTEENSSVFIINSLLIF